jgi:hypothetical protein
MTTITQDVRDIVGMDDNTSWTFYVKEIRQSGTDDAIISTRKDRKYPVDGILTVELDPGPAVVIAADGNHYPFTVPDEDSRLWPLIQAAVTIPPSTKHQELLDAVNAWLDLHTNGWDNITGKPAVIAAGATQAAARDAVQALGLVQAAKNPDLLVTGAITVDGNDLMTSAAVVWPDGSPGTLTITSRDGDNAVLEYNITYGSPVTKTFTQPAITRNANGAATNVPAIVVT